MSARTIALEALKQTAQALAWSAHGECRGYHDKLVAASFALELAKTAIAALEAEIAQEVEPVEVQMRVGKRGSWRKPDGGPERAYQLMRDNPGVYELRELFTAPQAVNAELLEACKAIVAWDDAENDATVCAEDGGAHWRMRQALCADAFDKARAAIAKAVKP